MVFTVAYYFTGLSIREASTLWTALTIELLLNYLGLIGLFNGFFSGGNWRVGNFQFSLIISCTHPVPLCWKNSLAVDNARDYLSSKSIRSISCRLWRRRQTTDESTVISLTGLMKRRNITASLWILNVPSQRRIQFPFRFISSSVSEAEQMAFRFTGDQKHFIRFNVKTRFYFTQEIRLNRGF